MRNPRARWTKAKRELAASIPSLIRLGDESECAQWAPEVFIRVVRNDVGEYLPKFTAVVYHLKYPEGPMVGASCREGVALVQLFDATWDYSEELSFCPTCMSLRCGARLHQNWNRRSRFKDQREA